MCTVVKFILIRIPIYKGDVFLCLGPVLGRVGRFILFRSIQSVLFKERSVLFRSFFEFLATYETQKNVPFFSKEWKRMQRMLRSFAKNGKERKERSVLFQRTEKNVPFFFLYIYRYI